MELKKLPNKFSDFLNKYKYVALVLLVGIILMLIPVGETNDVSVREHKEISDPVSEKSLEEKLSDVLSNLEGAGNVEVMLTVATGEEVIYQIDEDQSDSNGVKNNHTKTVTVTDSERNQGGLVKQIIPQQYKGAIVLCSGANDPTVRLQIVDAVSRVTGLGANSISVLKMK